MRDRAAATAVGCTRPEVTRRVKGYLVRELGISSIDCVALPDAGQSVRATDPLVQRRIREHIRRASLERGAGVIAVVAHAACDASPGTPDEQIDQLCEAAEQIGGWGLGMETMGLWVDESGAVDRLA